MTGYTSSAVVLFWMLFLHSFSPASCQVKVAGFAGDAVLLPCVYKESVLPETAAVFWRDKDDGVVLNIKGGKADLQSQDPKFKGRVFVEPQPYNTGNFSIQLRNATQADSGPYECHIPKVDFERRVSLTVSGKRVAATPSGPSGPSGAAAPAGGSSLVTNCVLTLLMLLSLTFTCFQ